MDQIAKTANCKEAGGKKRVTLHIIPHSHIDLEWYWSFQYTTEMLQNLFVDGALKTMGEDEELTFAQDQTLLLETLLEAAPPAQRAILMERIAQGKFEPVGGSFVQSELQEPCGESLVEQIRIGQNWLQKTFGKRAGTAWNTDAFGQIDQLPQILKQSGFDSLVFMRDLHPKMDPENHPTEFFFQSPDGSKVLTHWLKRTYVLCESADEQFYLKLANVILTPENQKEELYKVFSMLQDPESLQSKTGMALLLWGDDIYSLRKNTKQIKAALIEAAAFCDVELREEDIVFSTPSRFFGELKDHADCLETKEEDFNPPLWRQDLRASYISRIAQKLLNRKAERNLLSLQALEAVTGRQAGNTEPLWKRVLFSQFHDTMGGSCVDEVYLAAMDRLTEAVEESKSRRAALLHAGTAGDKILVWNPGQSTAADVVEVELEKDQKGYAVTDPAGNAVPADYCARCGVLKFTASDVPAYGFKTYTVHVVEEAAAEAAVDGLTMENEFYTVSLDGKYGLVTGIVDRRTGRQLVQDNADVIVVLEEKNPDMEGAMMLTGNEVSEDNVPAAAVRVLRTPLGMRAEIEKDFCGFRLRKTITLNKGVDRVDFHTDVLDYPGKNYTIVSQFNLAYNAPKRIYESPYSMVERDEGLYCAQNWCGFADDSSCTAVLNRGTGGYMTERNRMRLALMRGYEHYTLYAEFATERKMPLFMDGRTHTELACEKGDHSFDYALVANNGDLGKICMDALRYNDGLEAYRACGCGLEPVLEQVELPFLVTRLERLEDGRILIRGYNTGADAAQAKLVFRQAPKAVSKTNLLDEPQAALTCEGKTLQLHLRPREIATLAITF